jgi:acetyltransferase-like isoleucine patch superfamily enzyme
MIKKFLQRIMLNILPVEVIESHIIKNRVRKYQALVTIGSKSRLHAEAQVFNYMNDPSAIKIAEGTHIRGELLTFASGGQITIGSNGFIGEGTRIWSAESIKIGDNVLISHNCNIIDTDSHEINYLERAKSFTSLIESGHSKVKGNVLTKPILIEDYAWISYNVSILKGVTIGKGAIVAAGSVVTKDVSEFSVVAGNPAIIIKSIK